jgi:hypothetical protein
LKPIHHQDNNRPIELVRSPSEIAFLLRDVHSDLVRATKNGDLDQLKELFRFNTESNVNYRDEVSVTQLDIVTICF